MSTGNKRDDGDEPDHAIPSNNIISGDLYRINLPTNIDPHSNKWLKRNLGNKSEHDDVQVIKFSNSSDLSMANNEDSDSDIISEYIGHYGRWQFFWTFLLGLFQCPSTFHIFAFVFQVIYLHFFNFLIK